MNEKRTKPGNVSETNRFSSGGSDNDGGATAAKDNCSVTANDTFS